jgi:hypothetical protein
MRPSKCFFLGPSAFIQAKALFLGSLSAFFKTSKIKIKNYKHNKIQEKIKKS